MLQLYLRLNMNQSIGKDSPKQILIPKKILQRFPIDLVQANAGNASENLLNEMIQITYFLYRAKESIKKVYKYIKYKKLNKVIKQSGYYIYEF